MDVVNIDWPKELFECQKVCASTPAVNLLVRVPPVPLYIVVKNPDKKQRISLTASWTQWCRKKLIRESCSHVLALRDANSLLVIDSGPRLTRTGETMICPVGVRRIGGGINARITRSLLRRLSDIAAVNIPRSFFSSTSCGETCLLY